MFRAFKQAYPQVQTRTSSRYINTLTASQREAIPKTWRIPSERDAIQRTFQFSDFNHAWAFMSRIALWSEKHNHHPEWFNVYSRVEVTWTTHECKGLSSRDIKAAEYCDAIYENKK
ncbi:uncharacterized protein VTP21DRAFT_5670 [Calcarisporiella thermophila]|uniref:uncharacterized protein n=1 Tax=Calcarisporiella thermophila TaxID=911321 RepID=UPI003743F210